MTADERRAQKRQNRIMIAGQVLAAISGKCDLQRTTAAQDAAAKAVEFTDALMNELEKRNPDYVSSNINPYLTEDGWTVG